jgi:hypothetical protein
MQSDTNIIEFPKRPYNDGPRFIAWCYDRGALTIVVEGLDAETDGETLLTFTPEVGVEIGNSTVLALSGEPPMLLFRGTFAGQRDAIFSEWNKLAETNERPTIFDDEGLVGLARLPKLSPPSLPEIDEEKTARENEVLRVARERIAEISETDDLTLDDCIEIAAAVAAETDGTDGGPRAA